MSKNRSRRPAPLESAAERGEGFPSGRPGQTGHEGRSSGRGLVGLGRLERPTSRLSGVRSNQLSYRPESHPDDRTRHLHPHGPRLAAPPGLLAATPAAVIDRAKGRRRRPSCRSCSGDAGRRREVVSPTTEAAPTQTSWSAFRKEVIQPQVPLRLPCYDFTPVADPTVDACLPLLRLAQRLRVEPTPMV